MKSVQCSAMKRLCFHVDVLLVELDGVSRALDTQVISSERSSTDWVNRPVVASTSRHSTTLDEELVVRQCVSDVVVPAGIVVGLGVIDTVLFDVAADVGERQTYIG